MRACIVSFMHLSIKSKPEVFILESLTFEDEKAQRFEGRILADVLHLSGKKPIYYYFRTKSELERLVKIFAASKYRYLHLSCHGSMDALKTTLDEISVVTLASIFKRRL